MSVDPTPWDPALGEPAQGGTPAGDASGVGSTEWSVFLENRLPEWNRLEGWSSPPAPSAPWAWLEPLPDWQPPPMEQPPGGPMRWKQSGWAEMPSPRTSAEQARTALKVAGIAVAAIVAVVGLVLISFVVLLVIGMSSYGSNK